MNTDIDCQIIISFRSRQPHILEPTETYFIGARSLETKFRDLTGSNSHVIHIVIPIGAMYDIDMTWYNLTRDINIHYANQAR